MKAASRLTLVFTVLIGLFVLGVAVAVGTLLTFDAPGLPVVAGVAVAAGLLAAAITYVMARAVGLAFFLLRVQPDGAPSSTSRCPNTPVPPCA